MVKLFPMAIDGVVELFGEVLLDLDERTKKAVYCYLRKPPFPLVDLFIKHEYSSSFPIHHGMM